MSAKSPVIDVDAPIVVDLTQVISIDLTEDADIEELSPPEPPPKPLSQPPPRTRVTYASPAGPASAIKIHHSALASTSRNTSVPVERPAKRRKTEPTTPKVIDVDAPLIKRSSTPQIPLETKTKANKRVFELDSDGEDVEMKLKRIKQEKSIRCSSADEEDAYARYHAGYDLSNEDLWKPVKVNESKITFDVVDSFQQLAVSEQPPSARRRPHPDFSDSCPHTKRIEWRHHVNQVLPPHPRPIQSLIPTQLHRGSRRNTVQSMRLVTSFKTAPGSINRIEQSGDWVAICSAATGGQEDEPDEELNPYNKEGALMVWNEDVHMLSGHFREWESYVKHYTVNDVKFDPCSSSIVSSGNDGSVHIWSQNSDANSYDLEGTWRYQHVPHDLAFKPGGSVLAVAERRLNIYSNLSQGASVSRLSLFGARSQHSVGAIIWGRGPTASNVYASSEPKEDDFTGFHKAFDTIEGKMIFAFDESGSGDTMDVTEDGRRLALFTRGKERTHSLRIYDIQDANPKAVLFVALEPFASEIEGEVNSAAFSSDGIYLALGRNDNRTHVYDSRRLDRLLFDYEHYGPCRTNPGGESYGVVKVQWVDRSTVTQFGLVTGGHDGCVRFWDPLSAADSLDNGKILAEMNSDIGAFCIGDRYKGERPLVVGDCTGEVSVFDIRPAGFHSLYR